MGYYFYSFITMAIATWLYCEYLFPRRVSVGVALLSFFISFLALIGLCSSIFAWLAILPFFGVNFYLIWQNYDCAAKTAVLHGAFLTFALVLAECLTALPMEIDYHPFAWYSSAVLPRLLCYLVFALLGARFFTPHKQRLQEPGMMVLFCSLPVFSVVVSVVTMFPFVQMDWKVNLTQIALLVVNLIFFILYNHLQKAHAAKLELELSIQKEHSDAAHYQILQKQVDNQRILIHDIKNHLRTLDSFAQQGDTDGIRTYIEKLDISLQSNAHARLSSDPVLDMLLQQTKQDCENKHIRFYCDIREGCTGFMDAPSITALYGNLLSNALEGADSSAGRVIDLRVTNTEQGVVISIVNNCDIPPQTDLFSRLTTRKQDTQSHGVGLKSIERVVQRFGGIQTMYYEQDTHKFHHVIHFPR